MFSSKYSNFLTVILIVVIVIIIAVVGILIYNSVKNEYMYDKASEVADEFVKQSKEKENTAVEEEREPVELKPIENTITSSSTKGKKVTYGGYTVIGTIEIPSINIKYPILEKVTKRSIELAVAYLYGAGLNKVGNTVIVGHNYNNGKYFSNLKKLQNGDIVYITDATGTKQKYKVYNVYVTTPEDSTYYTRDTNGEKEISLSTCAEQGKQRTVVWAKAVEQKDINVF